LNAGVGGFGINRNTPPPPSAFSPSAGEGFEVGSGKLGSPWRRMHRASLTYESLRLSDGAAAGPAAGNSRLQSRCAETNAGALALMLFGITSPCPG
jgi:hypothetical protein